MNTIAPYERQLEYIQRKFKVSREYILETCRLSKVSLEKIIDCIENNKTEIHKLSVKA